MFTCIKPSTYYFDSNSNCHLFRDYVKVISKESYRMNIAYLPVTGKPSCGWEIIAIAADDAIT